MFTENILLSMNHVGLGDLNEYSLLVIFANAHSKMLVANTDIKPNEIKDCNGNILYPAYYMTRITIPDSLKLSDFKLWNSVSIGVDIRRFGNSILESEYVLGGADGIPKDVLEWKTAKLPYMEASNVFIIDRQRNQNRNVVVSNPTKNSVAELGKTRIAPASIIRARKIRENGFSIDPKLKKLNHYNNIITKCESGKDGPSNHTLMFAKYCEIMDTAEKQYLREHINYPLSLDILNSCYLKERETYYYQNCFPDEDLKIRIKAGINNLENPNYFDGKSGQFLVATFEAAFEVSLARDNTLLVISRVRKDILLPPELQDCAADIKRIIAENN